MYSDFYITGRKIEGLPPHKCRKEAEELYNAFFNNVSKEVLDKIIEDYNKYMHYHPAEKASPVIISFAQSFGNAGAKSLNSSETIKKILEEGFDFDSLHLSLGVPKGSKEYISPFSKGGANYDLLFSICLVSKNKDLLVTTKKEPEVYKRDDIGPEI